MTTLRILPIAKRPVQQLLLPSGAVCPDIVRDSTVTETALGASEPHREDYQLLIRARTNQIALNVCDPRA